MPLSQQRKESDLRVASILLNCLNAALAAKERIKKSI